MGRSTVFLVAGIAVIGSLTGWSKETDERSDPSTVTVLRTEEALELPDDPPAPIEIVQQNRKAPSKTVVERNGYVSVQVNVAEGGLNIEGDAANEPSIAVDPNAPLRMAIGWRQFDTTNSNFRQAGYGWSADGGHSWTVPGVLDPGIFRSDPVLASNADGRFYYYSLVHIDAVLCDMFISDDQGETWAGPIEAFGGDKAWLAIDTTEGSGRGNIYINWTTASNQFEDRLFIRSFDDGLSYTEPIALVPPPIWGTSTIGLDGELYMTGNLAYNRGIFIIYRSMDALDPSVEPPTFEAFVYSLGGDQRSGSDYTGSSPNPVGLLGQVWIASDHSDGPNRGNLYVVSSVDPPGGDPLDVHFIRSTDNGETWSAPVRVNTDDRDAWQWFGTMSLAPNGRIDVVWVESVSGIQPQVGELYYASSSDAGRTWTTPVAVSPSFNSWAGWPNQQKLGDYYHMVSDDVGADLAYAATFNDEQDVYYLRIGDTDCNRNGVGDETDLAAGVADCDANGVIDSCEIAARIAVDADGDGVIDGCQTPPRRGGRRLGP
jgi:hypothetical protein